MYRKLGLVAVTLVIIASMAFSVFWSDTFGNSAHAAEAVPVQAQPQYRISAEGGYITVYSYPQNTLYYKTDIPLCSLRQKDQEQISAGLYLYTPEELTVFLEDFGS